MTNTMRYTPLLLVALSAFSLTGCEQTAEPDDRLENNLISDTQQKRVRKVCRAVVLDLLRLESSPIIGFKPMKVCQKSKFGVEMGFDAGTGQTMEAIVMMDPYRIFLTVDGKSRGVCHRINDKERTENEILRDCMKL